LGKRIETLPWLENTEGDSNQSPHTRKRKALDEHLSFFYKRK
jgi:hypothetical protein